MMRVAHEVVLRVLQGIGGFLQAERRNEGTSFLRDIRGAVGGRP